MELAMRRTTASCAGAVLVVGALAACRPSEPEPVPLPQSRDPYFVSARRALEGARRLTPLGKTARNIILFVGDGMGVSTVTAARIFEGQQRGESGEENLLSFERLPYLALSKTYSHNGQVSDSASTGTALLTGVKTKDGTLGVDAGVTPGDCASTEGRRVTTALELAEQAGMATGMVTTTAVTHATPASTYAHAADRDWQSDADMPEEARQAGCVDIARQLLEFPYGDGPELVLGGGRESFQPGDATDPEDPERTGRRLDGRDLTREWIDGREGAAYVWSAEQLDSLDPSTTGPVLGLFQPDHMQYEADRENDPAGEPSLSGMTGFALDVLSRDPDGYFLLVESGRIDHAHHDTNAYRALVDAVELGAAVQVALDRTDPEDTLILVTADHSHPFLMAGYVTRGNPILGLARGNDASGRRREEPRRSADGLLYTTLTYGNGPGHRSADERRLLEEQDPTDPDYLQYAGIPMSDGTHSGEDVPVYARGPGAHLIRGVVEQNYLFHVMNAAARLQERAAAAGE
jgi:alkaline phosphatase